MNQHLSVTLRMIALSILFWIVLLGGIALTSRRLPARWYQYRNAFFRTRRQELRFYNWLHIRLWKDKLPELGGVVGFAKDHIPEEVTQKYLQQFLWETCYTEASHWFCMFLGYTYPLLSLLLDDPHAYLPLFFSVSTLNFFAHLPFIFIQRYNRPRLEALLKKYEKCA